MKQHRVGTFTLGLTFIAIGILVPLSLFSQKNAIAWMQFSPIILVALGVEILVQAIRFKDEKLKYDGLSIFFAILITVVTIGISTLGPFISRAVEYQREFQRDRIDILSEMDDFFSENDMLTDAWISTSYTAYDRWFLDENENEAKYYTDVTLKYKDKVPTKAQITQDAYAIIHKLSEWETIGEVRIEADFLHSNINSDGEYRAQIGECQIARRKLSEVTPSDVEREMDYYEFIPDEYGLNNAQSAPESQYEVSSDILSSEPSSEVPSNEGASNEVSST